MSAAFDDPNLIADAGLVPVLALAEQVDLPGLADEHASIDGAGNSAGANPAAKVMSLLAGMAAGADSIEDVPEGCVWTLSAAVSTDRRLSEALIGWRRPVILHDPVNVVLDRAVMLVPLSDWPSPPPMKPPVHPARSASTATRRPFTGTGTTARL